MTGALNLTYAHWCNRAKAGEAKPAKVLAHGGPYEQFTYGTFTEYQPGNGFGYHPENGDGPLQTAVICSEWTMLLGVDTDTPGAFTGSQTGKYLTRDDAWCTRGDGFHIPQDMRGIDPATWPKQGATGWGDIKNKGFLPYPGSLHYSGEPYQPTGKGVHVATPELVAAISADRDAHHEAMKAARDAARAAIADGAAPEQVADTARSAAFSFANGGVAAGSHREILLALLWECGMAGLAEAEAWAQWQRYSAPWDAARPWTRSHFENMWDNVPRKVADMQAERAAKLAAVPEQSIPGQTRIEVLNGSSPAAIGRPRFHVGNQAIAAEKLRGELGRGPLAGLFLRDGVLVHTPRTGEDGYIAPTDDEKARGIDHGPAQVRPIGDRHVKALTEVRYDVGKTVKEKDGTETWSRMLFPAEAARSAVGAAELGIGCPNLTHLAGITHTPVMRRDGTVLDRPGYDQATGLLYLPTGGLVVPPVPEHPSAEQIRAAVALIRQPIALFPWVAAHHEANYLGAMITPLLRLLIAAPYQFVVITATNRGAGKTFLLRMLGTVHGIVTRGEFPREADDLQKLILSTLFTTTAPVIGFDNIRGTVYSSSFESLLTSPTLSDRVLGSTKIVTVTNDRLWAATGNNARIAGDMDRRVLPVALDPRCADPYKRTFAFNPVDWMTVHRGEYIGALLTVARGWILAGSPLADAGRSDDYQQWYSVLRGLLSWAGVPGVFGAEDKNDLSTVSEDDAEWGTFVAELFRVFEDTLFTTADIVSLLDRTALVTQPAQVAGAPETAASEFLADVAGRVHVAPGDRISADSLPGELAEKWERVGYGKTSGFARSLGKWLSYRDGRFTPDGLAVRIRAGRKHARVSRFEIECE